mgnify:CR=1 FL=1
MPGFDRTGPSGQGPMTGRGLGRCNPNTRDIPADIANNQDYRDNPLGRGFGRGFGRGRGFGGGGRGMAWRRGNGFRGGGW